MAKPTTFRAKGGSAFRGGSRPLGARHSGDDAIFTRSLSNSSAFRGGGGGKKSGGGKKGGGS